MWRGLKDYLKLWMKMYSQGEEERCILQYFGGFKGRFLDIGAADGVTYSNTRALYEVGWKGVLVEPSNRLYNELTKLYNTDEEMLLVNRLVASSTGEMVFFDNQKHTLSSTKKEHCELFKNYPPFVETTAKSISWQDFIQTFPGPYHFVSIDTEGMDYEILKLIDLKGINNKMICVEKVYNDEGIKEYLLDKGYKIVYASGENYIGVIE
jgi:FkbM family methyltransferase